MYSPVPHKVSVVTISVMAVLVAFICAPQLAGYFFGSTHIGATVLDGYKSFLENFLRANPLPVASPTYSISGTVWIDENGDKKINGLEKRLPKRNVELVNTEGRVLRTATTNSTGVYLFQNVLAGTYRVRHPVPTGYLRTTDQSRVIIVSKSNITIGFGVRSATSTGFLDTFEPVMTLASNTFRTDPSWIGQNNRRTPPNGCAIIDQNFGWRNTNNAGGTAGEVGGVFETSKIAAYYAVPHPASSPWQHNNRVTIEGRISYKGGGASSVFVGFFNPNTYQFWPGNFIGFQITKESETEGAIRAVLGTANFRTRLGFNGTGLTIPSDGSAHTFAFTYDSTLGPYGGFRFTLDGMAYEWLINDSQGGDEYKEDPLNITHFGILNLGGSAEIGSRTAEMYIDNIYLSTTNTRYPFDTAEAGGWSGTRNISQYEDCTLRPYHNYGWSNTNFAGGDRGEIGGEVWRGNPLPTFNNQVAYYATPISGIDLSKPIYMKGRISFKRGETDSGFWFGFFNKALLPDAAIGIAGTGATRDGFWFFPLIRSATGERQQGNMSIRIVPDGVSHAFEFMYDPTKGTYGTITLRLDSKVSETALTQGQRASAASYDMFGIPPLGPGDGKMVEFYLDNLVYTSAVQ